MIQSKVTNNIEIITYRYEQRHTLYIRLQINFDLQFWQCYNYSCISVHDCYHDSVPHGLSVVLCWTTARQSNPYSAFPFVSMFRSRVFCILDSWVLSLRDQNSLSSSHKRSESELVGVISFVLNTPLVNRLLYFVFTSRLKSV